MYKFTIAAVACVTIATVAALDPFTALTVTASGVSYVLSAGQVGIAIASLGALALAGEGLLLAELSRGRGKRDTNTVQSFKLDPLFDAIAQVDLADCGKLLVCHVVAKNESELTVEEARIVKLFRSFNGKVDPLHAQAQYMLAAQTGSFKKPEVCTVQYQRCPYPADNLSELLKGQ
jgi:hypothetical protein